MPRADGRETELVSMAYEIYTPYQVQIYSCGKPRSATPNLVYQNLAFGFYFM
jgi:hypothetical protein